MLTKKEQALVDYYYNLAIGKRAVKPNKIDEEPEVKPIKVEVKVDNLAEDIVDRLWDIL